MDEKEPAIDIMPTPEAKDYEAAKAIIAKEISAEISGQLSKTESHESRVELLLLEILKTLKAILAK